LQQQPNLFATFVLLSTGKPADPTASSHAAAEAAAFNASKKHCNLQ